MLMIANASEQKNEEYPSVLIAVTWRLPSLKGIPTWHCKGQVDLTWQKTWLGHVGLFSHCWAICCCACVGHSVSWAPLFCLRWLNPFLDSTAGRYVEWCLIAGEISPWPRDGPQQALQIRWWSAVFHETQLHLPSEITPIKHCPPLALTGHMNGSSSHRSSSKEVYRSSSAEKSRKTSADPSPMSGSRKPTSNRTEERERRSVDKQYPFLNKPFSNL